MTVFNPFLLSGLDVLAAIVVITAIGGAVEAQNSSWTEMFIPDSNIGRNTMDTEVFAIGEEPSWTDMFIFYNGLDGSAISVNDIEAEFPYSADDPLRQHLHVYQHPSDEPTPVYFYSHQSGNVASMFQFSAFVEAGYSVISWESVTALSEDLGNLQTCWDDFELVWLWFQANAASYNFDPESVIIGGRSRGSMCSWPMAQSEKPGIKGIYMYNLVYGKKQAIAQKDGENFWVDLISTNSPSTLLVFAQECPKPIQLNCVPSPDPSDIHNPRVGQAIVDEYTELGIGSRISLTDGLKNKGLAIYELFPDFAVSLQPILDCLDNPTKKFKIELDGEIKKKDCPWLASKKQSKREEYCKQKVEVNGTDKKLPKICTETCGLVGKGQCDYLKAEPKTVDCTDNQTKKFNIEINNEMKTKDCPWLASKKKSKRKEYCKQKVDDNGVDKKLSKICKETCGLVGKGPCDYLKGS